MCVSAGLPLFVQVTHVVVDEVDTMLTQGFAADIEKLTRPVLCNPERRDTAQFVFVTATLTKEVRKLLDEGNYPKVRCVILLYGQPCIEIKVGVPP